ncbi:MAG TPA: PIN domain-containing protein, partial [Candidatus Limnocylindrales bacterium]|nr:PIN domain-containing protein [Candidatus Limnocylindrales bacterium]
VFLDSGIFIALLNRGDRHHAQAVTMFGGPRVRWLTSALVRSEAYSWFLHKYGEEAARQFRLFIDQLDGLTVLDTDPHHHGDVGRTLDRFRGAKLTYVDASSLAFMAQHDIKRVWATDHHLGLAGAEVLPRT